jgi:gliding motility-associated-like protein
MTRFLLSPLFLLISLEVMGQCPTLSLSATTGNTCGTTPVTVSNNTFGGVVTNVTITDDGAGNVIPNVVITSPFSFTYTPTIGDFGKNVVITVVTDNILGGMCTEARATYTLTVNGTPAAPGIGTITQPTCLVATGSVVLNNLPAAGWTLSRTPGNVQTTGTGTSTTISNLPAGTYSYIVTSLAGCVSQSSGDIVIIANQGPPLSPTSTVDCSLGTRMGAIIVTGPLGAGLQYSLDGGTYQSGTTFTNVINGNHAISVRNSDGCITTGSSFPVNCPCINQPSVTLSSAGSSTCGTNAVTVTGNTFGGSATSVTITTDGVGGISPGTASTHPFTFVYTPAAGDVGKKVTITVTSNNPLGSPCNAATDTYELTVNAIPGDPQVGTITQPTCAVPTGSVNLTGLPASGTWTLTRNPNGVTTTGTGTSTTITGLAVGTFTFTVTNSVGCTSASAATVVITSPPSIPTAPVINTIVQPTCSVSTGSVTLTGLPLTGTWTLNRSPGNVVTTGSGSSATIANLPAGTYTFSVTNSVGCSSAPSGNVTISVQPISPSAPIVGAMTGPTCFVPTGSVVLSGLPSAESWTVIRSPGNSSTTGTGPGTIISGIPSGTFTFTVTNSAGCVSSASSNVNIPAQPATPSPPIISTITQPRADVPTGSVVLNGLPTSGAWTLTLTPGNVTVTGNGITTTVSNLVSGIYSFTVTNSTGCTSAPSASFEINAVTGPPVITITNPIPVCFPSTANLTASSITVGSSFNLLYTYWTDAAATKPYTTPGAAPAGTYYIKGTNTDGFFTIKPVTVTVYKNPVPNAGPDQTLVNVFQTKLNAVLANSYETGVWSLFSGTGIIADTTLATTAVSRLSFGKNTFVWTVTNKACPVSVDSVNVTVRDNPVSGTIPTLITPNMDGLNDYFILKNSSEQGSRMELIIFDRRGLQVYKNEDYDNSWNGVNYNGKQLPDDTYFYVMKTTNGASLSGYIVVRRGK